VQNLLLAVGEADVFEIHLGCAGMVWKEFLPVSGSSVSANTASIRSMQLFMTVRRALWLYRP
jgi:hypothetical protein